MKIDQEQLNAILGALVLAKYYINGEAYNGSQCDNDALSKAENAINQIIESKE